MTHGTSSRERSAPAEDKARAPKVPLPAERVAEERPRRESRAERKRSDLGNLENPQPARHVHDIGPDRVPARGRAR